MDTEYPLTCDCRASIGLVLGWAMWLQFRLRQWVWETRPAKYRTGSSFDYSRRSARLVCTAAGPNFPTAASTA